MKDIDERDQQIEVLQNRLSKLSEASLRINESLNLDEVLQEILDSSRLLTNACCGVLATFDDTGRVKDFLTSGLLDDESQQLWETTKEMTFCHIKGPRRVRDFASYTKTLGLSQFPLPTEMSSFLVAPIRHRDEDVGNIYLTKTDPAQEFTQEDEETLVMFASQAALVIANARKHRDEQRARSDLETLINASPVGVVVLDAQTGVPVSVNREFRRIMGNLLTPGYLIEQLLDMVTIRHADGREIDLAELPLAQVFSTGEPLLAEEIVIQVPGGPSVTTLVNATPIHSEDGKIESVIVILQDMALLEELVRLRAEFLGMVSHELRVPLTSIRGSATTLLDASSNLDPSELRQFYQIIVDQADHMRGLIGGLLDVARIETGTLPVSPEPAEIVCLVDQARNTFLNGGGQNNLDLDLDLAADLPLVMADSSRIVQVLSNLLSNAAKYSPESSVIRVTGVQEDFHVAVTVADEGIGISAERLPHLFKKFSRIHSEAGKREREIGGSGLGLAICKGIVEAHGGRIWAESDGVNQGARFTFTIPVVEDAGTEATTQSPQSTTCSRQEAKESVRILAVDDNPQDLVYTRDVLSKAGFTSIVTPDPEDVPRLLEEQRPHLVLLDLVLPDADGIDVMEDIFRMADVPVIFVSGYGRDQVIARAFEKGATDYIVKPFSSTELIARVQAALRRQMDPYQVEPPEPYVLGDLTIDYAERRVMVADRPVPLTAAEYKLLFELSVNAGQVVTHDQLLRKVWGLANSGDVRVIRTLVKKLRRKLDDDASSPTYIFAEPRVGYRMPKGQEPGQET